MVLSGAESRRVCEIKPSSPQIPAFLRIRALRLGVISYGVPSYHFTSYLQKMHTYEHEPVRHELSILNNDYNPQL